LGERGQEMDKKKRVGLLKKSPKMKGGLLECYRKGKEEIGNLGKKKKGEPGLFAT